MEKVLESISMWAYLVGAAVSVLAFLVMPFSYETEFWTSNLLVAMAAVGMVATTAIISAAGVLSKNFPVHFLLVIGTSLLVSTLALTSGKNEILYLVQFISAGLLVVFIVCRLVIEFVINKPSAH